MEVAKMMPEFGPGQIPRVTEAGESMPGGGGRCEAAVA